MDILTKISYTEPHEVNVGILKAYVKVTDAAMCCELNTAEINCDIPFKPVTPERALDMLCNGKVLIRVNDMVLLFILRSVDVSSNVLNVFKVLNTMDESGQFQACGFKTLIKQKRYDVFFNTNVTMCKTGGNSMMPICWKGMGRKRMQYFLSQDSGLESTDLEDAFRDVRAMQEERESEDNYDSSLNVNTYDFIMSRKRTAFNGNVSMARMLENIAAVIAHEYAGQIEFDGLDEFLLDERVDFFVKRPNVEKPTPIEPEDDYKKRQSGFEKANTDTPFLDGIINEAKR